MNLSGIKLVVTDMDGTLLNSQSCVSDDFFQLFNELKKHDIHFVAASGRQYHSIIDKLAPIKDDITIIAENGGLTKKRHKELLITKLPDENIKELIPVLRKIDDAYSVLCGKNSAYIETRNESFIQMFSEYYNEYTIVDDLTEVNSDDFLKIAVYSFEGSEKKIYPYVKHYEGSLQVKISGNNWLDLSHMNANKGHALKYIQKSMNIKEEETLVFGDYNNDLEMLEHAHFSFAMENAHPNVIKAANYKTKSNNEKGVEFILEKLLYSKTK
ncbi:HAD family hydrolase [Abyssalbus ytuae]|uniref:HAD family hydrolase n=1 Tax=Abyssalbus ytuae TaxID=2926907 RepID=A0A9E7A1T7_9FLAO|nr:Cof-type HAD-IIB family hydrolase [Abyssalbus ytuae]UOB19462.1 HAD family hydrolase [Abyssalbus ytuae]